MLARFISADSIIPGQSDTAGTANPQHLNRYAYVENNPIKNTDPSGHDATDGAEGPVGPIDGAGGGSGPGAPLPVPPVREVQGDAELRGMTVEADGAVRPIGQSQEEAELTGRTGGEGETQNASEDYTDLTDDKAKRHILEGDETGGGHRAGTGTPNKSEFPTDWSDHKILGEVSDIATDPHAQRTVDLRSGRTIAQGTRDGVAIKVVIENPQRGERIVTGYPTNLPRNPR